MRQIRHRSAARTCVTCGHNHSCRVTWWTARTLSRTDRLPATPISCHRTFIGFVIAGEPPNRDVAVASATTMRLSEEQGQENVAVGEIDCTSNWNMLEEKTEGTHWLIELSPSAI